MRETRAHARNYHSDVLFSTKLICEFDLSLAEITVRYARSLLTSAQERDCLFVRPFTIAVGGTHGYRVACSLGTRVSPLVRAY